MVDKQPQGFKESFRERVRKYLSTQPQIPEAFRFCLSPNRISWQLIRTCLDQALKEKETEGRKGGEDEGQETVARQERKSDKQLTLQERPPVPILNNTHGLLYISTNLPLW